jgi:nicotinate-nucleotide adenylyltransferase
MDIAIFGGSFDPPHIGHEKIVNLVLNSLDIQKLFIIPTYLNPFKDNSFLDATHRLELIQTLFEENKRVVICPYEVNQKEKVPSYKTVQYLKDTYDLNKIYLIIGADNLKNIHLWYNADKLKELVEFVVITRDKHPLKSDFINRQTLQLNIDISSTNLRKNMELQYIPKKIQQKVRKLWKIE